MGHITWRRFHYLSFVVFALSLSHGLMSGTDSTAPWVPGLYLASGASVLFLTIYRVLVMAAKLTPRRAPARPGARQLARYGSGPLRQHRGFFWLAMQSRRERRRPGANGWPIAAVASRRLYDEHGKQNRPPLQTSILQPAAE